MAKPDVLITLPPLSAVTLDDQAGRLWIVTILAFIYVLLSAITRAVIKRGSIGLDDVLLFVGTLAFVGQAVATIHGLRHGLSKYNSITTESEWTKSGQAFIATEVLAILTQCLSKCSVIFLIHRVFSSQLGWKRWLHTGILVLSVGWGVAGMVLMATSCSADVILTSKTATLCSKQILRWRIVVVLDVVSEGLMCLLPVILIYPLQMPFRRKAQVVAAFSFRLPIIAVSITHYFSIQNSWSSVEPLYAITNPLIIQQAMLCWSLISATIPNLKAFMQSFSTEWGLGMSLGTSTGQSSDHPLQTFNLTIGSARTKGINNGLLSMYSDDAGLSTGLRPDPHLHSATVVHTGDNVNAAEDRASIASHGSQEWIIRKSVSWQVNSDSRKKGPA
ncbi:hypothetical protein P280DRAFT_550562 [Massarina eburnea CBS 473.64]|uniref:Rhodopsin domain-containing protein n=1 Tax=Massarina eburnea CBS 473.64 TaxID=1395130 RepID=A0A6A6RVP8_9PLEO|nr:hypothetical protein P280DRAFT_550562 [Massarina eburnea CBS 473.64]